ncbi:MFS transporter [Streptomyces bacillaris]|uniref:MFS transporter n=1 Tax=Streptomyces TaxID=1883 RepID=UPI00158690DE|nr:MULTISPECIES: MFS transporter [Streptomyces]NUV42756.1 MFS transporter [Streptomyces sp. CAI-24]NUV81317.1 MFS transporter [Streptomyces sp. CAI-155]NUV88066.1 MFS transporter [Streptomyces sp. KAI-26]NUW21851.1 MFS transporter [Streptomyces roseoviolaceus]
MQSALALPSAAPLTTGSLVWPLLGLLFAAVPVLVWARTARTRDRGTAVGAVLAVAGALLVSVQHGWVTGIPRADAHLLFGVTAPLVIWCGVRWERARRGPASEEWERRRSRSVGVLGAYVGLTVVGSLVAFLLAGEANVPPKEAVPALPPGLVALSEDTSCGSSSCARTVTVGSRDGLTNTEIIRRLDHPSGWTCRANGWLLDRRDLCVNVAEVNGEVQLNVSLSDLI